MVRVERCWDRDPSIVNQNIYAPKVSSDGIDRRTNGRTVKQVKRPSLGVISGITDLTENSLERFLVDIDQRHACPLIGEQPRRCAPHATGGSSHNNDLSSHRPTKF